MEESTNNIVPSRASAFRVVRPTSCYAPSLLAFPPQFWYSGDRFPYPSVSHYQDMYSCPSSGHVVTPTSDKLSFCFTDTTSSLCAPVSSIGSTGLQVHEYEKNDGGHRFLSPHTSSETGNNVIFHTSQAGQNYGQMEVWDRVPTSSNPVVCSKKSLCRSEEKKPARHNTTCSVCHKVFGRVTTLKVHLRIHRGEKPFKCSYCGKSFSQSGNLTTHIRVHTGEKPFSCKVCDKQFSQSSALKGHMKIHLREESKNSTSDYVNLPMERPGDEMDTYETDEPMTSY